VVIAGRGIIDEAAAQLLAEALRVELGTAVQCPSLGGLTGIAAAAQAAPDRPPDFVVLVSVGETTPTQLDLLLSRATRVFPASAIVTGNWGGEAVPAQQRHGHIASAESIGAAVDTISRLAAERFANAAQKVEAV
jgi:hypothetical protein